MVPYLQLPLILIFILLSHGVLDKFSIFTYHSELPLHEDLFWKIYHYLALPIAGILIVWKTWIIWESWHEGLFILIFSILPDLDWIARSILSEKSFLSVWKKEPILHKITFLSWNWLPELPDWRLRRIGVVLELVQMLFLWSVYLTIINSWTYLPIFVQVNNINC